MAGFTTNINNRSLNPNPVRRFLKQLSSFGMNYKDDVIRNVRSVDIDPKRDRYSADLNTGQIMFQDGSLQSLFAQMATTDPSLSKGYFNLDMTNYAQKREVLRKFAVQDEIEEILDIICDESIVFQNGNKFANIKLNYKVDDKIQAELQDVYNNMYNWFGFYDAVQPWNYFRRWLVDGFLAFEIVYNDDQSDIIGFVELDPLSLTPGIDPSTNEKIWYVDTSAAQITNYTSPALGLTPASAIQNSQVRVLYDSQIVYLSYAKADSISRISYVERLIRSFNLLRIMESTRIIWAVTNASYKLQFTIPVGSYNTKGQQTLSQAMNKYHELVDFNWDSGEIRTNGRPMMQFNKEYWFPSMNGESPQVQSIGNDGPELSDTETLRYFRDKLRQASKVPYTRFEKEQGEGQYTMSAEGIAREEIKFSKFISRLRSMFQEILVKPVYLQMCLKHHELTTDTNFRTNLGLDFYKDSVFEETKEMEMLQKRAEFISSITQSLVSTDSEGNQIPYLDMDFVIRKWSGLTEEDLKMNRNFIEEKKLKDEGYKDEDIAKIIAGAPKDNFKPVKKKKKEDEEGGDEEGGGEEAGNPLAGL